MVDSKAEVVYFQGPSFSMADFDPHFSLTIL